MAMDFTDGELELLRGVLRRAVESGDNAVEVRMLYNRFSGELLDQARLERMEFYDTTRPGSSAAK